MPKEVFLINPMKKRRKNPLPGRSKNKKYGRRNLVQNPLAETLMIVGTNPRGRSSEMLTNTWYGESRRHAAAAKKGWRKRRRSRKVVSAAPRRRKRRTAVAVAPRRRRRTVAAAPRRRRRTTRRASPVVARRRRAVARRSSALRGTSPRRYRRYAVNPRRRRRSYRRNPVNISGIISTLKSSLPLAVTGGASIIVTNMAPSFASKYVGSSQMAKYGVQVATAIGGGMTVRRFVGGQHATIWTVAGLAVIVADLANKYLLGKTLAGLGMEYQIPPSVYGMNAFPYEVDNMSGYGMGAFPSEQVSMDGPYDQTVGPY